jgi:hypothetical protein
MRSCDLANEMETLGSHAELGPWAYTEFDAGTCARASTMFFFRQLINSMLGVEP